MRRRGPSPQVLAAAAMAVLAVAVMAGVIGTNRDTGVQMAVQPRPMGSAPASETGSPASPATPTPTAVASPPAQTPSPAEPPASTDGAHGRPTGSTVGLTMFRGNPTRNWYGTGPLPRGPVGLDVAWQFPAGDDRLCSLSSVGEDTTEWCGTGWTGQPAVWERPDGITEVVVGAYDRAVHFLDAATGQPTRPPFVTGDLIKGSVTIDPDGFPLLYTGSRDNRFRVIALDREVPTELFALEPHPQRIWNNDWDGNAIVHDDLLLIGGEDSWFRVVELGRRIDADGRVQVDPTVLAEVPGFDDELFSDVGDRNVSIESSPLLVGDTVYVVNSGGLVSGFDLSRVRQGELPRTFRLWLGDDADATLVADEDGALYAAVELERFLPRSREVGQLVRIDPSRPDDPIRWSVEVPPREVGGDGNGGLWSTPAIWGDHLYATTHPGDLLVVDRHTGEVTHTERVGYHEWSSPVVVDDVLLVALCEAGRLRAWDLVPDPARPADAWEARTPTGACIESTPAVWDGRAYVGSRDGHVYGFG